MDSNFPVRNEGMKEMIYEMNHQYMIEYMMAHSEKKF